MSYLFIDTVWYQKGAVFCLQDAELLEVNAIWVDGTFREEKRYQWRIRPQAISELEERKLRMLNQTSDVLMQGLSVKEFTEEFLQVFETGMIMIVWGRRTYEVLQQILSVQQTELPQHQMVVLGELLNTIDAYVMLNRFGFEQALKRYHVRYTYVDLHSSEGAAALLKKLYCSAKFYYRQICEIQPDLKPVLLVDSNKIHSANCPHLHRKNQRQTRQRPGIRALWEGASVCRYCQRELLHIMPQTIRFVKVEKTENIEEYVRTLCQRFHLECTFATGVVFVHSQYAWWRIYHENGVVERVYHENYRYKRGSGNNHNSKFKDGYHRQQMSGGGFYEVLLYIARHDSQLLNREPCW